MTTRDPLDELLGIRDPLPIKTKRGFGSPDMDPDVQREIVRKGAKALHERGLAYRWTPEEAARAGKKGGGRGHAGKGRRKKQEQSA